MLFVLNNHSLLHRLQVLTRVIQRYVRWTLSFFANKNTNFFENALKMDGV